jgi:pimeloyl-ACP methyl ester carboxylesterase
VEIARRTVDVGGLAIHWLEAPAGGARQVLYLHGVPTASWVWRPLLERTGGVAPDLPGFGRSAKPAGFDYSIAGYDRFLESFLDRLGLERLSLVVHDWGCVGLAFAQRFPERIERLVMFSTVPLLPGYRWHGVARAWRRALVGELTMGLTTRAALRRSMPRELVERLWQDFDHGTQRAILKLHRSAPEASLARAGERLGQIRCPALILWSARDPYFAPEFGRRYAGALGGEVTLEEVDAGHWPWLERPGMADRVAGFLG